MIVAIAIAAMLAFIAGVHWFALLRASEGMLETLRTAVRAMHDPLLDDLATERVVQQCSLRLLRQLVSIAARAVGALAVAALPVVLADLLGIATSQAVVHFLVRPDVVVLSSVALLAIWWPIHRIGRARWRSR